MITWQKLQKMAEKDPWLIEAIDRSKQPGDERPLQKRVRESVAFVVFKSFAEVHPSWTGLGDWHSFFTPPRQGWGVYLSSSPVLVLHHSDDPVHQFSQLLKNPGDGWSCSLGESMLWHSERAFHDDCKVIFDAVVRPTQVLMNPHKMFAECYEVFKFPADFELDQWMDDNSVHEVHGMPSFELTQTRARLIREGSDVYKGQS